MRKVSLTLPPFLEHMGLSQNPPWTLWCGRTVAENKLIKEPRRGGWREATFLLLLLFQHWATRLHCKRSEPEPKLIPSTLSSLSQCFPYFTGPWEVTLNTELEHLVFCFSYQIAAPETLICLLRGCEQSLHQGSLPTAQGRMTRQGCCWSCFGNGWQYNQHCKYQVLGSTRISRVPVCPQECWEAQKSPRTCWDISLSSLLTGRLSWGASCRGWADSVCLEKGTEKTKWPWPGEKMDKPSLERHLQPVLKPFPRWLSHNALFLLCVCSAGICSTTWQKNPSSWLGLAFAGKNQFQTSREHLTALNSSVAAGSAWIWHNHNW